MFKSIKFFQQITGLLLLGLFIVGCSSSSDPAPVAAAPTSTMSSKISVDPLTRLVTAEVVGAGFTSNNAHIHEGAVGVDGRSIVQLVRDATDANKWATVDGARLTEDQYAGYLAGDTYFNIHSDANPGGEVRTQIDPITIDTSNVVFDGVTGDVSGYIMVSGFTPTNAHIHTGFAGTTGGAIRVILEPVSTTPGRFNLPVLPVAASVTPAEYNAGQLYFNVHSADFPAGHIREQITPSNIRVIGVEVNGSQVVPTAVTNGGTATAYLTVNESTRALNVTMNLHNIDDATAAHIHDEAPGANGGFLQDPATATFSESDGVWSITGVTLDDASLTKLLAGATYVNVHTTSNGAGEARGQIEP